MNYKQITQQAEEAKTITLEWKLSNLRELFEATKGETKSKVVKSPLFGNGMWQTYFYANSGDSHISLYLSCEPTAEEKARGLPTGSCQDKSAKALEASSSTATDLSDGSWQREGRFKFIFELRSIDKLTRYKCIDAADHQFSSNSRNWGWAQYSPRNSVYYNNSKVKADDALLICCTVCYEPTAPTSAAPNNKIPKSLIPYELVQAYASLFNDRDHSDVQFTIASPNGGKPKKLYAIKKILSLRSEYFSILLSGEWSEGQSTPGSPTVLRSSNAGEEEGSASDEAVDESESEVSEEDEEYLSEDEGRSDVKVLESTSSTSDAPVEEAEVEPPAYGSQPVGEGSQTPPTSADDSVELPRSVYATPSRKSFRQKNKSRRGGQTEKINVQVSDATYKSFRALLYFLYTDSIVFAPLASTFRAARDAAALKKQPFPYASRSEYCRAQVTPSAHHVEGLVKRDSLRSYVCNSKELFVLADKLNLPDLKARAYSHLSDSLSVSTVALEVFSPFSQHYEEIQNLQRNYLLKNWKEVRKSQSMKDVFVQVGRGGAHQRFPAFAEVFTTLLDSLEYVQPAEESASPVVGSSS